MSKPLSDEWDEQRISQLHDLAASTLADLTPEEIEIVTARPQLEPRDLDLIGIQIEEFARQMNARIQKGEAVAISDGSILTVFSDADPAT